MGRFATRLRADLAWVKANAEGTVAIALAVTMSVLGLADLVPVELVSKVIPLTLAVVAFAVLRDRWRQETANTQMLQTLSAVDAALVQVRECVERVAQLESLMTSTQRVMERFAAVRFASGSEVSMALEQARKDTDRWTFKGGTGAFTRVVTLPHCVRRAVRVRRELLVHMEILDPTDLQACERFAKLYRSLADGADDDAHTWSGSGTQIESYATILAACWYKQQFAHVLDIEIGLTSVVSMVRWDLSSRFLIVTTRGLRFPAMIVENGQPYYDSWSIELKTSFAEARKVPMDRALTVPMGSEPCVDEARSLFEVLGLRLPDEFTDADVEMIIEKALHDNNPFLAGAGGHPNT
ncbi:hypothetical protein [Nocardia crassostreae]|uniref:hypothetical protein n=1 Tax=Nocardia crassostreae TaxID=53428 RepID=UPI000830AA09|nr:hypothetical protein [Nocardia crassostreae]